MSPRVWFGFSIVALGWHAGSSSAQSVRTYRYELITISGESQFSGQPRPLLRGDAYRVQKDSLDRIVQTSHLENGKLVDRTVYHYAATEMLPDSYRFFEGDSLSAKVTIKRNTKGDRIRIESFEPSGESAQLTVNTIKGDIIEAFDSVTTPSSWLHLTGSTISHFSPRGLLVRRETHAGAVLDREVLYDELTGLRTSSKEVSSSGSSSRRYTYDAEGMPIRDEYFDASGALKGVNQYENGLKTSLQITFSDGDSRRLVYMYDAADQPKTTRYYVRDNFICTFTYEYLQGKIKRTLARGPSGELWAEYPGLFVDDIDNTGHSVDDSEAGVIHKIGAWW